MPFDDKKKWKGSYRCTSHDPEALNPDMQRVYLTSFRMNLLLKDFIASKEGEWPTMYCSCCKLHRPLPEMLYPRDTETEGVFWWHRATTCIWCPFEGEGERFDPKLMNLYLRSTDVKDRLASWKMHFSPHMRLDDGSMPTFWCKKTKQLLPTIFLTMRCMSKEVFRPLFLMQPYSGRDTDREGNRYGTPAHIAARLARIARGDYKMDDDE